MTGIHRGITQHTHTRAHTHAHDDDDDDDWARTWGNASTSFSDADSAAVTARMFSCWSDSCCLQTSSCSSRCCFLRSALARSAGVGGGIRGGGRWGWWWGGGGGGGGEEGGGARSRVSETACASARRASTCVGTPPHLRASWHTETAPRAACGGIPSPWAAPCRGGETPPRRLHAQSDDHAAHCEGSRLHEHCLCARTCVSPDLEVVNGGVMFNEVVPQNR